MNPKIIETDVPLQLVVSSSQSADQVVLKIPPRTRIIVGDTIQIKRKPSNASNRKRQGDHVSLPLSEAREPTKDEVDQMDLFSLHANASQDKTLGELLQRAGFEMPRTEENQEHFSLDENESNETISWNNIQLKPDVYTGQLTPMPKHSLDPSAIRIDRTQWSQFSTLPASALSGEGQEDSNWYFPLPPLDLQDNIPYEDLTPSSKQIIDEIREMNLWNDALGSDVEIDEAYQECHEIKVIDDIKMGNDDSEAESDEDIQIDQLDLCEEQLNHIPVNCNAERSDSLDTAEVLSEFDICDKV
jgi:hypothetical protein